MIKKKLIYIIILTVSFTFLQTLSTIAIAQQNDLTASELLNNPEKYNGKKIVFRGELIGEPLGRGNYRWVNVADNEGNAMGVWLNAEYLKDIKYFGRYNIKGDTVEIEGIYHSICNEHTGETDIHANSFIITKEGYTIKEIIKIEKLCIALILGIAVLIMLILSLIIRKYQESLNK